LERDQLRVEGAALRIALVVAEREQGEEDLPLHREPLAVVFPGAPPRDELTRDGLAGPVVTREAREHVRVPGPLLEQLARDLDEVALGRDARETEPAPAPREHGGGGGANLWE